MCHTWIVSHDHDRMDFIGESREFIEHLLRIEMVNILYAGNIFHRIANTLRNQSGSFIGPDCRAGQNKVDRYLAFIQIINHFICFLNALFQEWPFLIRKFRFIPG